MAVAAVIASVCEILEKTLHHQQFILCDGDRVEIGSLLQEVSFLRDSLSNTNCLSRKSREIIESIEVKIIDTAKSARYFIQSHIMEQLIPDYDQMNSYLALLNEVASEISSIDQEVRKIHKEYSNSRNRILLTTRLDDVAVYINSYPCSYLNVVRYTKHLKHVSREIGEYAQRLLKALSPVQDILETYSHQGCEKAKSLENQIINAAQTLKDLAESCVTSYKLRFSPEFFMAVKQMVMKIEEADCSAQDLRPWICSLAGPGSSKSSASNIVGLDADFSGINNRLAGESQKLEVISLVGMGGIGKTTLAGEIFTDKFILEVFLVRAWITVSQFYDLKQIIIGLLDSMEMPPNRGSRDVEDLEEHLYKSLKGRRYMIVIDDVWDSKLWDDLRPLFPDDKNSSRILLTTRLQNVAVYANSCCLHHMRFLDGNESWNLFCNKVFGEDCCPPELDEIGKKIVLTCGGLPLVIIMVGGLFSKDARTLDYWRSIAEDLSSEIISSDDRCSEILSLSYTHLPGYLKKCFLYAAIFPKGYSIRTSQLVQLWIADGILEPLKSNSLEDRAYEYLLDLVDRSLLLVDERSSMGGIKACKVHDIVRDFCLKKAKSDMLCHISDGSLSLIPVCASVSLLSIYPNSANIFPYDDKKLSSLQVSSLLNFDLDFHNLLSHLNPRLLRVFHIGTRETTIKLEFNDLLSHNLRYYASHHVKYLDAKLPSALYSNLRTLILGQTRIEISIWSMPQQRHVKVQKLYVSDPLEGEISALGLENLQTLSSVMNFTWSVEIHQRIPNLKKLGISYDRKKLHWQYYCLNTLACLHKLEALTILLTQKYYLSVAESSFLHIITFPPSLKKLTLQGLFRLPWKDMVIVGSLPYLEVLKLKCAFRGKEWESIEGQFPKLKYLLLEYLDLEQWKAELDDFPSLQCLIIRHCPFLKELPSCIGEIPTLQLLKLHSCIHSLVASAKDIQQEQLDLGNDDLQVLTSC